jgi:hypothetical protein
MKSTSSRSKVTEVVFASRGYSIDQPLVVAPRDSPNTFTDITASTISRQFLHRRVPKRDEGGRWFHRQWNDAFRLYPGEVRRAGVSSRYVFMPIAA